ncbi:hypothetical protein MRX96_036571 [Rhipicephalus microplus]
MSVRCGADRQGWAGVAIITAPARRLVVTGCPPSGTGHERSTHLGSGSRQDWSSNHLDDDPQLVSDRT